MAYYNQFEFAPAPWLPIQDRQVLDSVGKKAFDAHIGKAFDNPDFELSIVPDVNNSVSYTHLTLPTIRLV